MDKRLQQSKQVPAYLDHHHEIYHFNVQFKMKPPNGTFSWIHAIEFANLNDAEFNAVYFCLGTVDADGYIFRIR